MIGAKASRFAYGETWRSLHTLREKITVPVSSFSLSLMAPLGEPEGKDYQ